MNTLPEANPSQTRTIQFAPVHLAWLEEMARQGESDVSTVLFWIIHTASRMNDTPWPLGASKWRPFEKE